jgi:hypothetical protein
MSCDQRNFDNCSNYKIYERKERYQKLHDVIKGEGFETYLDEERGGFTFIEAREL